MSEDYLLENPATIGLIGDEDTDYVLIPEWTGADGRIPKVRVRSLMSDQKQRLGALVDKIVPGGSNALLCAMGMIKADGSRVFKDEMAGAQIMGEKHPEIVARIGNRIWDLSGQTKEQREAFEKKSQSATQRDSPSFSAEQSTQDSV